MSSKDLIKFAENNEWSHAMDIVTLYTQNYKSTEYRINSDTTVLDDIVASLQTTIESLQSQTCSGHNLDISLIRYVTETFRCLRNACAGCPNNQTHVGTQCLVCTVTLLQSIETQASSQELETLIKCVLQFVGNTCVGNPLNQKTVMDKFLVVFRKLLQSPNSDIINYTCMVLHNCLLSQRVETLSNTHHDLSLTDEQLSVVIHGVVETTVLRDLEWGLYVLEDLIQISKFFKTFFEKFSVTERLFLVEVLIAMLKKSEDAEQKQVVATDNLEYLTSELKTQSLQILQAGLSDSELKTQSLHILQAGLSDSELKTQSLHILQAGLSDSELKTQSLHILQAGLSDSELKTQSLHILQAGLSDSEQTQALLLVKILEALGLVTSMHSLYGSLQQDSDLLVCSLNLLHGIHTIGKEGGNHFSSVEKVTQTDLVDPHHPAYGLRRDLIRLIANLVYRHRANQDKVRELDGIPLILDQSNIDGRNPFISQWVVLAVRNLCEENTENKQYLAGLRLEGLANSVEMLQEFGVSAEVQGDKVIVKPSGDSSQG